MKAERLPYDMGNAGDLIKHGLLAEFTEWWLSIKKSDFVFLDPFGGRPYVLPPHPEVIRRLHKLSDCALKRAQPDIANRYYGSAKIVKNIATSTDHVAHVKVSDRNQAALDDLLNEKFELIELAGFDRQESFSIIDSKVPAHLASLLLLDPFDDFIFSSCLLNFIICLIFSSSLRDINICCSNGIGRCSTCTKFNLVSIANSSVFPTVADKAKNCVFLK